MYTTSKYKIILQILQSILIQHIYLPVLLAMLTIFSLTICAFTVFGFNISWVPDISFVLIIKTFCLKSNKHKYYYANLILAKYVKY